MNDFPLFQRLKATCITAKKKSTDLTMNIFYTKEKNNSVKKQLPRTHLTLSLSRTRSLLSPPLCHKQVSVWTWTLNWNKHNSFIKSDFTNLIGSNKATEKGQVIFQFDFMVEVSRQDHKHTKTYTLEGFCKPVCKSWQDTLQTTSTTVFQVLRSPFLNLFNSIDAIQLTFLLPSFGGKIV